MNKQRRSQIAEALELINEAKEILEEVRDAEQESYDNLPEGLQAAEQESYDNLPEGLQAAERGEQMQENVDNLEEFIGYLEETGSLEEM